MKTHKTKSIFIFAVWLIFGLTNLSPSMAREEIISGETKFTTIEFGGETHSYDFWAEANHGVIISMGDMSSAPGYYTSLRGLEPRVQLYDPNGIRVADVGSNGTCYSHATIENY